MNSLADPCNSGRGSIRIPTNRLQFELLATDAASSARRGRLQTPRGGVVETPAFMPVGTQGAVKGVTVEQLRATGAQMVLGNTYHLALRPGMEVVRVLGGLHRMMDWDGPILTDSGGFQIFSLAETAQITEAGAVFRSHIDGSRVDLSPERSIEIQETLGSDVAMQLDHVVGLPAPAAEIKLATERSVRWAERCLATRTRGDQALFGIVQGGLDPELRRWSARELVTRGFDGYAVGGLSVGESAADMAAMLDVTVPELPSDKPRYLMGVGRPEDLLAGIHRGIDLFDCVMPTRNGRNGLAFTGRGTLRLRNEIHKLDPQPLEPDCPCPACRHSRGYLRHLFHSREMLGPILLSIHNLTYYQRLMAEAREAITANAFSEFCRRQAATWQSGS